MASASDLPKLYQGVQKQSFGYKMLATMGWKEGLGLGANHQGITEHIKVKKKQDAFGVGAAEQAHKLRDWTTGMVGYDAILSGLKEITRDPAAAAAASSDDSDSSAGHSSGYDSDSDTSSDAAAAARKAGKKQQAAGKGASKKKQQKLSKAGPEEDSSGGKKKQKKRKAQEAAAETAAAAAGKKRQKRAAAKADASSSSSGSDSDDSSGSESSDSDGQPAAAAAGGSGAGIAAALASVSRVKAATHVGRYAKRERAKTVRNYSASDLAAILGLPSSAPVVAGGEGADAWAAAAAAAGGSNARQAPRRDASSSGDTGSGDDSDSSSDEGGSEQRLRPGTPPGSDSPPSRGQLDDAGGLNPAEGQEVSLNPDKGGSKAWWRSVFVKSGGSSIGMQPRPQSINAHGFLEDDQTNLYMQAHAAATTGKQGLGRSSMPKKVAGARWQGTKTKLGSDNEDDEQQQQQEEEAAGDSIAAAAAAAGREQYVKNGILIVLPLKKQQQQPSQEQPQEQQQEQRKKGKKDKKAKKHKGTAAGAAGGDQQQQEQQQPVSKKRKQQQDQAAAAAEGPSSGKKSKKATTAPAAAAAAAAAGDGAQAKPVKWAKLAAKILEGAPKRRMRIQKLHKQVVAAAGYDVEGPGVDAEALYQQMLRKLRKSEGLQVCDKYVGLAKV